MARGRKRIATIAPVERNIPEKLIHQAVIQHWRTFGLPETLLATLPNANAFGQPGLTPGLADLLAIGPSIPGYPCGFIELKKNQTAKRSDAQWRFAALCHRLGIPYACVFGRDEPIRLLERWGMVKRAAA